jgi:hypothetical protein
MKKIILILCVILTVALLLTTGLPVLAANEPVNPNSYTVNDGKLYDADGKQFKGAEIVTAETEGGIIYWLAVNPDADGCVEGLYEGWKGGIYFFGGDGNFISMLAREHAQESYVWFSSDGKQFILSGGTFYYPEYLLYGFHGFDGFELKKSFGGTRGAWIDNFRIACSTIDRSKNARYEEAYYHGWLSVVVYDSAVDLFTTVIDATATEDFMMLSVDHETDELVVAKFSVKDEKDWGDREKREYDEICLPVPPAG